MRVSRTKRVRKRLRIFLYILLSLVLTSGLSLGAAWAWQGIESGRITVPAIAATAPDAYTAQENPAAATISHPHTVSAPAPASLSALSADGAYAPDIIFERPDFPYALPRSAAKAERSYFRGAVFIGDSLTAGMSFYIPLDGAAVVARAGITPVNAQELFEAVDPHGEWDKVYIMFGADSLKAEPDEFAEDYGRFIDAVRIQYPGARVFVQSIPPVTRGAAQSNARIDEYNLELMRLARDKRVHFLDVNSALRDDFGYLPEKFAPSDGIHPGAEAYYIWLEYLRWHT
jgi:hypothetical protein